MKTVLINIKTDPKVKKQAQKIAAELGVSLSSILNAYLKQFIRNKTFHVSLQNENTPGELPNSEEEFTAARRKRLRSLVNLRQ